MQFETIEGRRYARFEQFADLPGLAHAFSTRPHNVAPREDDGAAQRAAHRAQMATDLGLNPERLCWCQQVHDATLAAVCEPGFAGRLPHCDGAATSLSGVPLMSFSADCPLVLLYDPVRGALGLVHASWRCTVAQLCRRMVALLGERFGSAPANLHAGIGPGAGPCCYEVQEDVYAAAAPLAGREELFARRGAALYFDLWRANRQQLVDAGVPAGHIETAGVCTMCRNDLFYSFRREGKGCGHFGLMAALR